MEHLPTVTEPFPSTPGIHLVDPTSCPSELFALDCTFAEGNDNIVAFTDQDELVAFFTEEHKSDTYVLNDESGVPVGSLSIVETSAEALEVLSIGVASEMQGHGYGTLLMSWAEALASHTGRSQVHLVTKVMNTPAIRFYEKLGYTQKEIIPNHYSEYDQDPRVRMEKQIL